MDKQEERTEVIPRRPLWDFVKDMELKLRKHDEDRGELGWREDSYFDELREALEQELKELKNELIENYDDNGRDLRDFHKIAEEAADVANFAMMISDMAKQQLEFAREEAESDE